jgi:hypothetical protein
MVTRMSWCRRQIQLRYLKPFPMRSSASGHGGIFQYSDAFVDQALRFFAE